jgi:phage shock protein A
MSRAEPFPATLTYRLLPSAEDLAAVRALLDAYRRIPAILDGIRRAHGLGANVVALTTQGYQAVRDGTGLPARLVTLGIRDLAQANGIDPATIVSLPLDEKLFAVKGASAIALTTLTGRRTLSYRVQGYGGPWRGSSSARLVVAGDVLTIQAGVAVTGPQEAQTMPETILTRVGRIIGGLSNAALDAVEDRNGLAIAQQALREIDDVIEEARRDLGKVKAEEHRLGARRGQLEAELGALPDKLETALASGREDLARAGISRQLDLESQIEAIDSSLASVAERHEAATKAVQAALAARRDAEHRIGLLSKPPGRGGDPLADYADDAARAAKLERSLRAIDRATGTASAAADAGVEDLDRLHRDHAIAQRLAALKQARPT